MNPFISLKDALCRADRDRLAIDPKEVCIYGIKPLDDALSGIIRSDLVVIGADTGAGKTELANYIAYNNAAKGRKVCLISLEGERNDFINRMKYRHICENYYKNEMWLHGNYIKMSYKDYVSNRIENKVIEELNNIAREYVEQELKDNIFIFDKQFVNDIDRLIETLGWKIEAKIIEEATDKKPWPKKEYRSFFDLIIIDHLHYFDMPEDSRENENQYTSRIMREIKKFTEELNTPVVLISHLRKKTRDRGIPDIEDLHGSSNIPKISTTTILITPHVKAYNYAEKIYPTFIRIAKSRSPEVKPSMAILVDFNGKTMKYNNDYSLYKIIFSEVEPLEKNNWPDWAKQ